MNRIIAKVIGAAMPYATGIGRPPYQCIDEPDKTVLPDEDTQDIRIKVRAIMAKHMTFSKVTKKDSFHSMIAPATVMSAACRTEIDEAMAIHKRQQEVAKELKKKAYADEMRAMYGDRKTGWTDAEIAESEKERP